MNIFQSKTFPGGLALLVLGVLALGVTLPSGRQPEGTSTGKAAEIVGPRRCAECHEAENLTWLETAHHQGFKTLARRPEARAMSKALGIRRLKTEARCVRCHFTEQMSEENKSSVIAGVSCESCHGAGKEWLDIHGDYGGEEETRHTEQSNHREERIAACFEAGMRGPDHLYELAARCFDCHLIVDEELHGAGHGIGSGFELVNALQGEVRHNFVRGEGENVLASPERCRILYMLGLLLEMQCTLEALDRIDPGASVAPLVTVRALAARRALWKAAKLVSLPAFEELVELLPGEDELSPGHPELNPAASAVERVARWLTTEAEEAQLAALDELVRDVRARAKR